MSLRFPGVRSRADSRFWRYWRKITEGQCSLHCELGRRSTTDKPGTHPVGPELAALHEAAITLGAEVHLQIESYYLFAKIILDDVARAIEYHFGAAGGLPLDSLDDLARSLAQYSAQKDITVAPELIAAIADLKL